MKTNKTLPYLAAGTQHYTSASGDVVTFHGDGSPLKSLVVSIRPVQEGSGDPSPTNVRPISGWTGCKVNRMGKNLNPMLLSDVKSVNPAGTWAENVYTLNGIDFTVEATEDGVITKITANNTASATTIFYFNYLPSLAEGTEVIISGTTIADNNNYVRISKAGGINIPDTSATGVSYTMPDGSGRFYANVRIGNGQTVSNRVFYPMVRLSTDTDPTFEPYNPASTTIPITWQSVADTVYGGTLDVTNGVLTVDRANIASYSGEALPGEWISDRDVYAPGTTPTIGAQVVYTLATPITIPLTQTEISTLQGQKNNVWADCGPVSVEYHDEQPGKTAMLLARRRPELLWPLIRGGRG